MRYSLENIWTHAIFSQLNCCVTRQYVTWKKRSASVRKSTCKNKAQNNWILYPSQTSQILIMCSRGLASDSHQALEKNIIRVPKIVGLLKTMKSGKKRRKRLGWHISLVVQTSVARWPEGESNAGGGKKVNRYSMAQRCPKMPKDAQRCTKSRTRQYLLKQGQTWTVWCCVSKRFGSENAS